MKILGKDIYAYVSFPNRLIKRREMALQDVLAKPHLAFVIWGLNVSFQCIFSLLVYVLSPTPESEINALTRFKHVDSAPWAVARLARGCHRKTPRASDENRPSLQA